MLKGANHDGRLSSPPTRHAAAGIDLEDGLVRAGKLGKVGDIALTAVFKTGGDAEMLNRLRPAQHDRRARRDLDTFAAGGARRVGGRALFDPVAQNAVFAAVFRELESAPMRQRGARFTQDEAERRGKHIHPTPQQIAGEHGVIGRRVEGE